MLSHWCPSEASNLNIMWFSLCRFSNTCNYVMTSTSTVYCISYHNVCYVHCAWCGTSMCTLVYTVWNKYLDGYASSLLYLINLEIVSNCMYMYGNTDWKLSFWKLHAITWNCNFKFYSRVNECCIHRIILNVKYMYAGDKWTMQCLLHVLFVNFLVIIIHVMDYLLLQQLLW